MADETPQTPPPDASAAAPSASTAAPVAPTAPAPVGTTAAPGVVPPVVPVAPTAPGTPPAPEPPAPTSDVAALRSELDAVKAVIANTVKADLAALTPAQQEHVRDVAGADPVAQRRVIDSLKARGMLASPPVVVPTGATTGPSPTSQPTPAAPADTDAAVLAEYEALDKAGAYLLAASLQGQKGEALARARAARAARRN